VKSVTEKVAGMKIEEPTVSKAKSKNLDVPAEFAKSKTKNSANFVVIGQLCTTRV